jgi:hypothetical protein
MEIAAEDVPATCTETKLEYRSFLETTEFKHNLKFNFVPFFIARNSM